MILGWFDKGFALAPWRRRAPAGRAAAGAVARVPGAPAARQAADRKDFTRYLGDDDYRERYWRQAESRRLGDEFSNWSTAAGSANACKRRTCRHRREDPA